MLVSTRSASSAIPGSSGESRAQLSRAFVILRQPIHVVLERINPRGRDDAGLAHRSAEPLLEDPRLLDERGRPRQHRADRSAQPFREIDPHANRTARRKPPRWFPSR